MQSYDADGPRRRTWMFERIGWVCLGTVLLAAVAGVFGGRRVSLESADGTLVAEYPRSWRSQSPLELRLTFVPPDGAREVRLWLGAEYLSAVVLEQMTPETGLVELGSDRLTFLFDLALNPGARSVVVRVRPRRAGVLRGSVGVDNGATLVFDQFIFP